MKLETYKDLEEHLLMTMDSFTDQMCKGNSGISKEKFWNICMSACQKQENKEDKVGDIMWKNVLREFPEYVRDDYQPEPTTEAGLGNGIW